MEGLILRRTALLGAKTEACMSLVKTTQQQQSTQSLERIARAKLGIEALETRRSDELDFHEVAVWSIRAALEAAYEAGRAAKENER